MKRSFLILAGLVAAAGFSIRPAEPLPYPLKYPAYFGNRVNVTSDNPLTIPGVALGRHLFYEKRLSRNNTISCSSCHQQALAFSDGRKFSVGFDGVKTKRNSMSLANLLWVRNFFWDGRSFSLENQAMTPLTDPHEMGQLMEGSIEKLSRDTSYGRMFALAFGAPDITQDGIVKALGQFERTLISADAPYDRYIRGKYQFTASERRGLGLFFGGMTGVRNAGCSNCHGGPKTFDETYHNNGLDQVFRDAGRFDVTGINFDRGRFRVVTLRNIALTAPYMHDGRFNTLSQVIDHYSDHIRASATLSPTLRDTANMPVLLGLSQPEKKDLLAFLGTLTDSTFIKDERFSDPKIN